MTVKSTKFKVRWQPQYKPSATKTIITGYIAYAYSGLPAFKVLGTERVFKTEREAKKYASALRKLISS